VTTGIEVAGNDLDALLLPRGANTPIANVHIQSNGGVDLSQRFAGAAFGTPYGPTNIKSAGVDIGTLFAALTSGPTTITLTAVLHITVNPDFFIGFVLGTAGAVSPSDIRGDPIGELDSANDNPLFADRFSITAATDPGAAFFTTLSVSGGGTRSFASASYSYTGGTAIWIWSQTSFANCLFTTAGTYSVTIS
jgi:hypothetical protein